MTPRKAMICSLSDSFLILSLGVTASKLLLCCSWNHRSLDLLSIHVEDDVFKRRIEDHIFDLKWPWPAAAWNGAWVPSQRLKSGPRGERNHLWLLHPGGASGKEPAYQCRRHRRLGFNPWVRKIPWRRAWQSTPVFLPGESHGQREPGGLQAMGSQRVGHKWSDLACMHTSGQRWGPDFGFAEKFPQRLKAVIQVKCLLGGERIQCKWIDTEMGSEREPYLCGSLNHFYGAFLLGFLWPCFAWFWVCLVYLRVLQACLHISAKMDSSEEVYGELPSLPVQWRPFAFWPPRRLSVGV